LSVSVNTIIAKYETFMSKYFSSSYHFTYSWTLYAYKAFKNQVTRTEIFIPI